MCMSEDAERLFEQALIDVEHAEWDEKGGYYEWACLSAHKAAELSIKALYALEEEKRGIYLIGREGWRSLRGKERHQPLKLLKMLQNQYGVFVPEEILRNAYDLQELRYEDEAGHQRSCELSAQAMYGDEPSLGPYTPHEIASMEEAGNKIEAAKKIVDWVKSLTSTSV